MNSIWLLENAISPIVISSSFSSWGLAGVHQHGLALRTPAQQALCCHSLSSRPLSFLFCQEPHQPAKSHPGTDFLFNLWHLLTHSYSLLIPPHALCATNGQETTGSQTVGLIHGTPATLSCSGSFPAAGRQPLYPAQ